MFFDNKILGVGVKNFRNFCSDEKYKESEFSCSTHPHSTYIQVLAETGIIGFLFLIIVLLYFCKYVFKHLFLRFKGKLFFTDFQICILSAVAIYLWPFIPTGNVFNNWLNIIMILNLPFLILSRKKN
jgi:O-antigen ligase